MTDPDAVQNSAVKSVSVKVTLNGKSLGVDAFITLEQVDEFIEPVDDFSAYEHRNNIAGVLLEQGLELISEATAKVKAAAAANPIGHVSVHQVQPQAAPAGVYQGQAPTGTPVQQVQQVANGASPNTADGWLTAPNPFKANEITRFISSAVYPTDALKAKAVEYLHSIGISESFFEIWDERVGKFGGESGHAISGVIAVKLKEDHQGLVPPEVSFNEKGKRKAQVRAKFNDDGSLFFYQEKEFEKALKWGLAKPLSLENNENDPF